jgi:hypothetical protein
MLKLEDLRNNVHQASQLIADRYPTKRRMKPLIEELEKLSPGEQERFEREARHLVVALEDLLQLMSERELSGF